MKVEAPWTELQVETLNRYQSLGLMHPYTCPRHEEEVELHADTDGWHCEKDHCSYHQSWAHSFTTDPAYVDGLLADLQLMQELNDGAP